MSWKGVPKKENYFPLFAEDWNLLVDAVDELYYKLQTLPTAPLGVLVGGYLYGDLLPALDLYYSLGDPLHRFLNVWAKNVYADPIWTSTLYASENVLVQGKPVLKDGDPIYVADLLSPAQETLKSVIAGTPTTSYVADFLSQAQSTLKDIIAGTPVSAYVSDLSPQAQETLKKVLVNSVLARDLWETVPLLIQFETGDGVMQVHLPPLCHRTVVRGWYAVSTATSGLAQLRGAISLTPVALIPLSVPSISVPDIFLRLYYEEPLLLYYSGATLGAYLQLLVNILNEWTGVSLVDPSGLDPYDPLWMPSDGWTYVYRFRTADEVTQVLNYPSDYEVVENGVLKWNLPPDTYGWADRDITGQAWRKVAVCLRIRLPFVGQVTTSLLYFRSAIPPDSYVDVDYNLWAQPLSLKIRDLTTLPPREYDFMLPDDWFVIVVENDPSRPAYIRIYDRNRNLLFETQLNRATVSDTFERVSFLPQNVPNTLVVDMEVDWIAFKY